MANPWQSISRGVYFTSCLTQCVYISPSTILTAGTDGHAVLWPLPASACTRAGAHGASEALTWNQPIRIHQNSSKTLATHQLDDELLLLVSGGDDGSLAFLLAKNTTYSCPPIIVTRAHASAVTACAILMHESRILVITSGNDQWVRLWQVTPHCLLSSSEAAEGAAGFAQDPLDIKRAGKSKISVADVSSMALLGAANNGVATKVLICGVGMEVIHLDRNIM